MGKAYFRKRFRDKLILVSYFNPEGGHGNPLQYTCLENPMDRGAWRATVYGVTELDRLNNEHFDFHHTVQRIESICVIRSDQSLSHVRLFATP